MARVVVGPRGVFLRVLCQKCRAGSQRVPCVLSADFDQYVCPDGATVFQLAAELGNTTLVSSMFGRQGVNMPNYE